MNINKGRTDYIFGTNPVADAVDDVGGRIGAAKSDGNGIVVTAAVSTTGSPT